MKSLSSLMEAQRERERSKVNICDSANRKRNVSQAGWEAALRAWLLLRDVVPVGVAVLNPELLKGTPGLTAWSSGCAQPHSWVREGLGTSRPGHHQPLRSLEIPKKEQLDCHPGDGHFQLPPPHPDSEPAPVLPSSGIRCVGKQESRAQSS